jgi:hypothetical protein
MKARGLDSPLLSCTLPSLADRVSVLTTLSGFPIQTPLGS